jgi:hypothetical protein
VKDHSLKSFVFKINSVNSCVFRIKFAKSFFSGSKYFSRGHHGKAHRRISRLFSQQIRRRTLRPARTQRARLLLSTHRQNPKGDETGSLNTPLRFVYPDSYAAIQHNLFLVIQLFSEGRIDNRTANTYNRLFRACEQNLSRAEHVGMSITPDEPPSTDHSGAREQSSKEDRYETFLLSMNSEISDNFLQSTSSHPIPDQLGDLVTLTALPFPHLPQKTPISTANNAFTPSCVKTESA